MPTLRTRAKCSVPATNSNPTVEGNSNVSVYEKCREDRIKENLQRMQNLGILDLSLQLKSETRPVKRRYTKANSNPDLRSTARATPPSQLSVSTRRSSRLKNATPVTYFEEAEEKKGKASKEESLWLERGERPEIYTDEHEKLLGNTEQHWELFVDGYDKNGKRIYDPVRGKTCHQCRQKTLGYRTQCSRCHPSVTGQFCGDCLYMRYGEHVLEALENPDWICPGCRGICNCSFCRKDKGWFPTGAAYRKVCQLGYKSVAHYLILTNKQSKASEDDETDDAPSQASAKRSLSFREAKASSEEDDLCLQITDEIEMQENHIDANEGTNKNPDSARKSLSFLSSEDNQTSVTDVHALGDIKPLDVSEMDPATSVIDVHALGDDIKPLDVSEMDPATSVVDAHALGDIKPLDVSEMDPATSLNDAAHALGDIKPLDVNEMDPATSVIDVHAPNDIKPLNVSEMDPATSVITLGDDVKPLDVNEMDPATPVIIDVEAYSGDKENGETRRGKRKMSVEPSPNSIGGRLRQRLKSQA